MPLYITLSAVLVTTLSCWRVDWNTYILCFSHGCYRTFSTGTYFFSLGPIHLLGELILQSRVILDVCCPVSNKSVLLGGVSCFCVSCLRSVQLGGVSCFCVSNWMCVQLQECPAGRCVLLLCVLLVVCPAGGVSSWEVCPASVCPRAVCPTWKCPTGGVSQW